LENVEGAEEAVAGGVVMVSVDGEDGDCDVDVWVFVVYVGYRSPY
jgi:hypothetical protein